MKQTNNNTQKNPKKYIKQKKCKISKQTQTIQTNKIQNKQAIQKK